MNVNQYYIDLTPVFMSVMGTSFKNCRLKEIYIYIATILFGGEITRDPLMIQIER